MISSLPGETLLGALLAAGAAVAAVAGAAWVARSRGSSPAPCKVEGTVTFKPKGIDLIPGDIIMRYRYNDNHIEDDVFRRGGFPSVCADPFSIFLFDLSSAIAKIFPVRRSGDGAGQRARQEGSDGHHNRKTCLTKSLAAHPFPLSVAIFRPQPAIQRVSTPMKARAHPTNHWNRGM